MTSELREVLEKLARRMGFEGAELKAWCDDREAAELEEERVQREFEREMEKKEREIEELKLGTLQLQLQLAEAEQARLVRERRERMLGGSSSDPAFEAFCRSIGQENEPLVNGHDEQLNISLDDGIEVGSRESNHTLCELDEPNSKFGVEEHGSSIEDQFSGRASRRPSTFEEAREPPKHDGQCRSEISKAFVAHSLDVPLPAGTHDIGIVQDYLGDLVVNRGKLSFEDSTAVACANIVEENEQGLINAGAVESEIETAVWESVICKHDPSGMIDSVKGCTTRSVEGDLELLSVLGEEQSDAKTPELRPIYEMEKKGLNVCTVLYEQ